MDQDSTSKTYRTVELKLYLTKAQKETLSHWLGMCANIYNLALDHRVKAYQRRNESPSLFDQQKMFSHLRLLSGRGIKSLPSQFVQDVLRRLDNGMERFFKRCAEKSRKKGFPRKKKPASWKSMECLGVYNYCRNGSVHLPKIGEVRCRGRKLVGLQKGVRVVRKQSGWYVQFLIERPSDPDIVEPRNAIGLDLGLEHFATLSTGEHVANPRLLKQTERRRRIFQRRAARKVTGSKNSFKSLGKVSRIHERVVSQRRDFCHQLSRRLVNEFEFVGAEDLNIRGLANGKLSKSVTDAGWGIFLKYLTYKAASAGRQVVKVNPAGTSQECPECGAVKKKELSERVHRCECGCVLQRDVAASRVILDRALAAAGRTSLLRGLPMALVMWPSLSEPVDEGSLRTLPVLAYYLHKEIKPMKTKPQTIGEILAAEADKKGINRIELAKLTGRSKQSLYLLEKSTSLPFETVRRIAQALGLSIDGLIKRLPPFVAKK